MDESLQMFAYEQERLWLELAENAEVTGRGFYGGFSF